MLNPLTMQVNVRYLENLRLEASFDDFSIIADQPVRYKGDGLAPGPFDYFLASSAMCAAYFVKVYCKARSIPTEDIRISQNNIVDPENRYKQTFKIIAELPESISEKDRKGILASIERCSVKRVIQNAPEFIIEHISTLGKDAGVLYESDSNKNSKTMIIGKDSSLEDTIANMSKIIKEIGIKIEIASWRNPVPNVWSVHVRDADSPMCYTNGKGSSKDAALCSALGEYLERISNNYFYNDFYLGEEISKGNFVHYPDEKWFLSQNNEIPAEILDENTLKIYNPDGELKANHLVDTNSGNKDRGICAIPFERQSDGKKVYFPVNLVGNLFVSNGMSAGNSKYETRVQCLSEIFERAVKNKIIKEELTLPDVPQKVLTQFPNILEGINKLEETGFPVLVKDASLGGRFPVMCVTLMNPRTGGVFTSFGAHPKFEVALERSLTELLQGRSFEGLNDVPPPTFNTYAVQEHNNIVDHFIDSTGVVSWRFFKSSSDYVFKHWNHSGNTEDEYNYLMDIFKEMEKEVYIADYTDLGAAACRILVPGYSEIYEIEDLIWDNNNQALDFRTDVLNIHSLNNDQLLSLVERLEDSQIDNYTYISELIGIAFDESTVWGQLTVGELKGMIYLALENYKMAKEQVEMFLSYNDNTGERKKFYQALNILLDIKIEEDLELNDYIQNLNKMYGSNLISEVVKCIEGEIKFHSLEQTDLKLTRIDKHQKLIESYKKLIKYRKKGAN